MAKKNPSAVRLGQLGGLAKAKNRDAVKLGRKGGRVKSEKKAAACRANGRKYAKPKKPRSIIVRRANVLGLPRRRSKSGQFKYEIEPGRWVSRQRVEQLQKRHLTVN